MMFMIKVKQTLTVSIVGIMMAQSAWAVDVLRMSTTTSTENSGLLTVLNSVFEKQYNARLDVIAVGTGKALRIGGNGDVDVVFVHAPAAELEYVEAGDFIDRSAVMHNDFVMIGPINDPADIKSAKTITEALQKIHNSQSTFISRGDDSGTHKKEVFLWKQAGIEAKGLWYVSAGQGMGAVLRIADEKQGYTLTDRGTQIAFAEKISLQVVFEGGLALFNPYHVMAVNPKKHLTVNYQLAKKYIDFVSSEKGQKLIAAYKKGGQQLFYPDVIN